MVEDIGMAPGNTLMTLTQPCRTKVLGPAENPIAIGFPGLAGTVDGSVFTWNDRITANGGHFYMCWCGVGKGAHSSPTYCDEFVLGMTYTATVGRLRVEGPYSRHVVRCKFGRTCRIN